MYMHGQESVTARCYKQVLYTLSCNHWECVLYVASCIYFIQRLQCMIILRHSDEVCKHRMTMQAQVCTIMSLLHICCMVVVAYTLDNIGDVCVHADCGCGPVADLCEAATIIAILMLCMAEGTSWRFAPAPINCNVYIFMSIQHTLHTNRQQFTDPNFD